MSTANAPLDTAALETLKAEVAEIPDEVDGIPIQDAKVDATYKLGYAIQSLRRLAKLAR